MGQKVNPVGFRVGVYRDWDSSWFARGNNYSKMLLEDVKIRKYLAKVLDKAEISKIKIDKTIDSIKITVHTAKPGIVIGRKGQEIDSLRKDLSKEVGVNSVDISVEEVKRPGLEASLVAQNIAEQLEKRVHFKKATKRAAFTSLKSGAKGIKICTSGRLGGAEIARSEWTKMGSVPLHTLRSDIDYSLAKAKTKYGIIGVKVWICRGNYQNKKRV